MENEMWQIGWKHREEYFVDLPELSGKNCTVTQPC